MGKESRQLTKIAESCYRFVEDRLGPVSRKRVGILLCATEREYAKTTSLHHKKWSVAAAMPEPNLIVLKSRSAMRGIGYDPARIVTHELAHIAVGSLNVPVWFNEGLAMFTAGEMSWNRNLKVAWHSVSHNLLPLADLESEFPSGESAAALAYAESISVVSFLASLGDGPSTLRDILALMRQGDDFDEAIRKRLRIAPSQIERLWKRMLRKNRADLVIVVTSSGVTFFMTLLVVIAYARHRQRARTKLEAWAEQDRQMSYKDR